MENRKNFSLFDGAAGCRRLFFLALFAVLALGLSAQSRTVSGTVTDKSGESVIGASVVVKGTTNGTITDFDGNFTLQNVPDNGTIQVSFVGYKTVDIPVAGKSSVKVTLEEDTETLDEVVVVGYGVQKKSDVTGAVTRVSADDLVSRPVTNAFEALQGKAAGVDITSNSRPGEVGEIMIRGQRSLKASSSPLYVIDGVPVMSESTIETLNPRDIQSVDVLKDASATAIYGSRGANGVIIITTKRGETGKLQLNFSGTWTLETLKDKTEMMNASDYITYRRWAFYNQDPNIYLPGNTPTKENDEKVFADVMADMTAYNNIMSGWVNGTWDPSRVVSTDWGDLVKQTALTQEYTLSASGGTDKMQAYASFGYLSNKGTQKGQGYERYTTNINVDLTPQKWFKLGASINATYSDQDYGMSTVGSTLGTTSSANQIYDVAKKNFAYALPYDENGEVILHPGGETNIGTVVDEWNKTQQQRQTYRVLGSFYAQLDFGELIKPLKGLTYRINFGPDFRYWREGAFSAANSAQRALGNIIVEDNNYARLKTRRDFSWTLDNQINYNRTFDKHTMGITLLQTASSWNYETMEMSANGIPEDYFQWNAMSSQYNNAAMSSGLVERQLESYMIRLNYSFNDRYLLTASGRWDGASQLSAGNKWAFFPSMSLGWRIDQEEFMKDIKWINQLKLRAGFGVTGNAAIDPYSTLGSLQKVYIPFGNAGYNSGGGYLGWTTNEPNYTKDQLLMANPNLGWEKTSQYNIGLDFSVLNGRISGALDAYWSRTNDLIMTMTVPTLTGYGNVLANVGKTKNHGIELQLNTVNIKSKDFEWNTSLSGAYQKDAIVELANGKQDMINDNWFIGESINVIYSIDSDGLWTDSAEDMAAMEKFNANGHNFKPGMTKPIDQDGNWKIDDEDRVIIGSKLPRWTFGMTNSFNYKNFDLSFMVYGRFGYKISTDGELLGGRYNQRVVDYWTPENPNAEFQMPYRSEAGGDAYYSTLGYRSGSFLKMRNISLGYTFPKKLLTKSGIERLKIYAQVTNPFTIFSGCDWLDLDTSTASAYSSIYNQGIVLGIDLSF